MHTFKRGDGCKPRLLSDQDPERTLGVPGGEQVTSLAALKESLRWQEMVARTSNNPAQRARCLLAIAKLTEQIKEKETQA